MTGKSVWLTGAAGYLATALCRQLDHLPWCETIHGLDIKEPLYKFDKMKFHRGSILDESLSSWVAEIKPDVLIHLAFIVDPIRDEEQMRRVNVGGTENVLRAARHGAVPQILVASSGTAYGAWPDNPIPLRESHPIRPHPSYRYAIDKVQVERLCQRFIDEQPHVSFSIIRPCVVYGPLVDNYLSDLLTALPWVTGPSMHNPPVQFVHEDDVAGVILAILEQEARGPFNVAPSDYLPLEEVLAITQRPKLLLGDRALSALLALCWRWQIRAFRAPPSVLDFLRYPWVLDNTRVQSELGYGFRYSTRETLESMLRGKRVLER